MKKSLPCPLCGGDVEVSTEVNGIRCMHITVCKDCQLTFITEGKLIRPERKEQEIHQLFIQHLRRWNTRKNTEDIAQILAYAKNIDGIASRIMVERRESEDE